MHLLEHIGDYIGIKLRKINYSTSPEVALPRAAEFSTAVPLSLLVSPVCFLLCEPESVPV